MERVPERAIKDILKELKSSTFYDFAFHKEDLIHTMERKGYLNIVRGSTVDEVAPLTTSIGVIPMPSGHVYVPYDMQIDVSVPFALFCRIDIDNKFFFGTYFLPSVFYWKNVGWFDAHDNLTITLLNQSLVSTTWFSLIIRFLDFEVNYWNAFEENFLHPLEYYVTHIMEGKKPEKI